MNYIKCSLLFLLTFSCAVNAGPWSGEAKIRSLYPATGGLIFFTDYKDESISSCDGGTRFVISKDHPNYQVMVSSMMAAFVADLKIKFFIEPGQTRKCEPIVTLLQVYK
ncbi:hypothetical protein [Vibrio sp.]|uniref:hypothetical protein n=1 Tax=Vibrio sp. TaxID=678 RepID=UPI00311F504C